MTTSVLPARVKAALAPVWPTFPPKTLPVKVPPLMFSLVSVAVALVAVPKEAAPA